MAEETKARRDAAQAEADSEEVSLHDALSSAFDEFDREDEEDAPQEEVDEQEEEQEEVEASDEDTEDAEEDQEDSEDAADEDEEEFEFPNHWSEEDKKTYNTLPDEAKDWFVNKYKEFERGTNEKFQEIADYRKEAQQLDEVFKPVENELRLSGLNRVTATARLMQAHQALSQDPANAIGHIAQSYLASRPESERQAAVRNFAKSLGMEAPDTGQADEYLDEAAARRIQELESRLHQVEGNYTSQQQAAHQQQVAGIQQQIEGFRSAQDESGKPRHPHFDEVQNHMASLIQSGAAADLESAYEQAVWANPKTREAVLAEQQKKNQAKRKQEVQKAKKAQKSNVKGRSSNASRPETQASLRDELSRQFEEHGIT